MDSDDIGLVGEVMGDKEGESRGGREGTVDSREGLGEDGNDEGTVDIGGGRDKEVCGVGSCLSSVMLLPAVLDSDMFPTA